MNGLIIIGIPVLLFIIILIWKFKWEGKERRDHRQEWSNFNHYSTTDELDKAVENALSLLKSPFITLAQLKVIQQFHDDHKSDLDDAEELQDAINGKLTYWGKWELIRKTEKNKALFEKDQNDELEVF